MEGTQWQKVRAIKPTGGSGNGMSLRSLAARTIRFRKITKVSSSVIAGRSAKTGSATISERHAQAAAVLIGEPKLPEPTLDYGWVVDKVTPVIADGKVQQLQIPQVPFGNEHTHFALTVFYDLLFYGVRWSTIRKEYHQDHITEADVREFIRSRGRCVLRELGGNAYTVVNANPPTVDEIQNNEKEAAYV